MTYFEDLSDYAYFHGRFYCPGTKNVGWVERGHEFDRAVPSANVLDSLWSFCSVSVAQTRGFHQCEFCEPPRAVFAVRNGRRLFLGTSEIRVFSKEERIYAAPTLIYHYVRTHHYNPPAEFLRALVEGPRPPAREYFDRLRELQIEWKDTSGATLQNLSRAIKVDGKVALVEVPNSIHVDED